MLGCILLSVGWYWIGILRSNVRVQKPDERLLRLLRYATMAAAIAYVALRFCFETPSGPAPWGVWGRVGFVSLTTYLTVFFSRYLHD